MQCVCYMFYLLEQRGQCYPKIPGAHQSEQLQQHADLLSQGRLAPRRTMHCTILASQYERFTSLGRERDNAI